MLLFIESPMKQRIINETLRQLTWAETDSNDINKKGKNIININFFSVQHQVTYSTSYKIFLDNKLFGIGPKLFRLKCKEDQYKTKTNLDTSVLGCQTHPHHTYLQLFTETGIIGAIPVIIIFLFICFYLSKQFYYKFFKKTYFLDDFKTFLLIAMLISLWPLAPSGNFFNNWICIIYFLPVAFLLNYSKKINIQK